MTRARDLPGEADGSATDESAFGSGVPHPVRFWPCGGDLGASRSPFNWSKGARSTFVPRGV